MAYWSISMEEHVAFYRTLDDGYISVTGVDTTENDLDKLLVASSA
jgi:hypothetical protein